MKYGKNATKEDKNNLLEFACKQVVQAAEKTGITPEQAFKFIDNLNELLKPVEDLEIYKCSRCEEFFPSISNSAPPKDGDLCIHCHLEVARENGKKEV